MPYEWEAEKREILDQLKLSLMAHKTLEDPFTKMTTIQCCKEGFDLPTAVYEFIHKCNPRNKADQVHAFQSVFEIAKHAHINILSKIHNTGLWQVKNTALVFCQLCYQPPPIPAFDSIWQHVCVKNEWAINYMGKTPTLKWHAQAQCWTFTYSYHNKLDQYLRSADPLSHVIHRDEKAHVWLIADSVALKTFAVIKQWLPNAIWAQNTKRAAPPTRAQISTTAIHAETILHYLPPDKLKTLTRETFMALHPDRGGNQEDFVKFKLALEAWNKKES